MKIGIVDADLLDKGTRFPNLAAMKISGHWKRRGADLRVLLHRRGGRVVQKADRLDADARRNCAERRNAGSRERDVFRWITQNNKTT